ncbi:hypothetical protein HaLaN_32015 [Haematococcus lacustris]|uniref:Uncharacterized protein n=1 Tax=Haematococcus lacustris TaxID=44745 RepID=A0A6A0AJ06_HAELA|nr:hypothetical protein HaLaN_32015 [Haematococcus lacustris]
MAKPEEQIKEVQNEIDAIKALPMDHPHKPRLSDLDNLLISLLRQRVLILEKEDCACGPPCRRGYGCLLPCCHLAFMWSLAVTNRPRLTWQSSHDAWPKGQCTTMVVYDAPMHSWVCGEGMGFSAPLIEWCVH